MSRFRPSINGKGGRGPLAAFALFTLLVVGVGLWASASAPADSPSSSTRISAGGAHSCGIRGDGTLVCWGDDSSGQLDGVPNGAFSSVSAGGTHSCAIRVDGRLACWGDNSSGQLDGVPTGQYLAVSAGGTHTCAIRVDGRLACWGDNSSGQLDGVPTGGSFRTISAGGAHTCAIRGEGSLSCWGDNSSGQSNTEEGVIELHRNRHQGEADDPQVLSVAAGGTHTCAIPGDSTLVCWGDDSAGQLDGIPGGEFRSVSAGLTHSCAIRTNGRLACWGDDSSGQLDGIPSGQFLTVSAGGAHSCAAADGSAACWGDNELGQAQPFFVGPDPPGGVVGEEYSHRFETTPQNPGPSFEVISGAPPPGLVLGAGGELSGTPTAAGEFTFGIAAANGVVPAAEREVTLTVVGGPLLTAQPAVGVDIDSAELRGSIDPQNLDAEAWFEYWPTAASPLSALATPVEEVEAGVGPQDLSAPIGGLAPDTEYSFRLAATNAHSPDPVHSETLTLRTDAPPPPPVVAFVDPGLPPPTAGVNVNLEPVAGTVRTKCPSDPDFVRLANPKQVPLDCLVDTSLGTVDLTAAKGIETGTQSAFFWGGVFDVAQTPGHNYLTELSLAGRRKCEKKTATEGARSSRVLARRRGAGRELWGSGKGNYSTTGSYGSATVRGTTWLVKDRCDNSTLFAVREGIVQVRDFVKGKTLSLYPGQRYVAKAAIPALQFDSGNGTGGK
ncbi:MAG: hypothetical protein QOF23_429 [Solirubrobacterales bacterium]|nr:hypothetical protein [Solirubrobacterales bacterium]